MARTKDVVTGVYCDGELSNPRNGVCYQFGDFQPDSAFGIVNNQVSPVSKDCRDCLLAAIGSGRSNYMPPGKSPYVHGKLAPHRARSSKQTPAGTRVAEAAWMNTHMQETGAARAVRIAARARELGEC